MSSRLRSWDDALERLFARVMPRRWGPYGGPGAAMVGMGVTYLTVSLLLVAVLALAGRTVLVPLVNAALGLCLLAFGVRRNRREHG
jgi:hypothetical protein